MNCGTTINEVVYCYSCRPELADRIPAVKEEEGTQRWFAVWSMVLWAAGLALFIVNMALPETAPDEVFGYVLLGVILCLPAGLALGILALRRKGHKHKGMASVGVALNSITLAAYIVLFTIGLLISVE